MIRPSCAIKIGRLEKDPEKLQMVYDLGCADGNACLEALKSICCNKSGGMFFRKLQNLSILLNVKMSSKLGLMKITPATLL